jgi:hypothetical protein
LQRLIASPRIVTLVAPTVSPLLPNPMFSPSISIRMMAFVPWPGPFVFADAPPCE